MQADTIVDLSPKSLLDNGIKGLIIDFDGALASHAKMDLTIEVQQWLKQKCSILGVEKIFILSNKPTITRKQYFAKHFPGLNFIIAKYKKPFPYSIFKCIKRK